MLRCSDVSIRPPAAVEGGVGGAEQRGGPETGRGPGLEHQQLQFYLSLPQSSQHSHRTAQPGQRTEPHPKERQVCQKSLKYPHADDVLVLGVTLTHTLPSGRFRAFNSARAHRNTVTLHVTLHQGANGSRFICARRVVFGTFCQDAQLLAVERTEEAGLIAQIVHFYVEKELKWALAHRNWCMYGEECECCSTHDCVGC